MPGKRHPFGIVYFTSGWCCFMCQDRTWAFLNLVGWYSCSGWQPLSVGDQDEQDWLRSRLALRPLQPPAEGLFVPLVYTLLPAGDLY